MSSVLLTTDGSDIATAAMTRAIAILGREHTFASLAVVPSAFLPGASVTPMDTHPVIDPELEEEIEREGRVEGTTDLAELDKTLGITSDHILETGEPGQTICEVAARIGADVVVVGSHGYGWLQRVLIGSVSHHVLHNSPCPVLVMRRDEGSPPPD